MNDRILICIGGGELKSKTTVDIDRFISDLVKNKFPHKRPTGLFIGTASHDSMPYFNSFRKTYTSLFDIKADCALLIYGEMDDQKIKSKFENADFIYVGGGDTVYMLDKWKAKGVDQLLRTAYENGKIICGLSAGAICWFETMFTDSATINPAGAYSFFKGLNYLDGVCCPHFALRKEEYLTEFKNGGYSSGYAIEDDCALIFVNEKPIGSIYSGKEIKKAYKLTQNCDSLKLDVIPPIADGSLI